MTQGGVTLNDSERAEKKGKWSIEK
jgi:hypothetical protein